MTPETLIQIQDHAKAEYPRESCGLIVIRKGKERYWPCRNLSTETDPVKVNFHMHHEDSVAAEESGDVVAVVHSHPNGSPLPSQADLVACEASELPWVIIGWPTGEVNEFAPTGYQAPLIGRVFAHGVLDCYSIIRDWYQQELQIELPNFVRPDGWWHTELDLYREHFAEAGFHAIDESQLKKHDVILMQLASNKTNHGAIYLGSGIILHHPMNRLSGRDQFGGFWHKNMTHCLRHKDLT